jgi:hypothetical protein
LSFQHVGALDVVGIVDAVFDGEIRVRLLHHQPEHFVE